MKRTVDEKVAYNSKLDTPEAIGYVVGVKIYRDYLKRDTKGRQTTKHFIDAEMELVKSGNGSKLDKALLAGYRDAANERKACKS